MNPEPIVLHANVAQFERDFDACAKRLTERHGAFLDRIEPLMPLAMMIADGRLPANPELIAASRALVEQRAALDQVALEA